MEVLRERYPTFKPRNDYDILAVVTANYTGKGTEQDIYAWVDDILAFDIVGEGLPVSAAIEGAKRMLDAPGSITGVSIVHNFCQYCWYHV